MSAPLDPGSILLAGAVATIGGSVVLAALPRRGTVAIDVPLTLGERLVPDRSAGFAAGVILHVAFGMSWAFVSAVLWNVTGWPVAPTVGALFAVPQWMVAEAAVGASAKRTDLGGRRAFRPRGAAAALLLSHVVYGALLGATYRPGA